MQELFTLTSLASPAHSGRDLVQSLVSVIAMIISPAKKVLTGALNLLPSVCQGSQLDTPCMEVQATWCQAVNTMISLPDGRGALILLPPSI